nr:UDP-N-acetylglucosamine 1-carboxyvinyltransferase [bacterium]
MQYIRIRGGKPLEGEITISGGKNAVVAIIPAAILSQTPVMLENVPYIEDVFVLRDILVALGAKAEMPGHGRFYIDSTCMHNSRVPDELAVRMRASYYFCSALLARFGEGIVPMPGGCAIGTRPVDQTLKGLSALGAEVSSDFGQLHAKASRLKGAEIFLDCPSVGATINTLIAAVLAEGQTTIVNAGREPHIVDVASFLNSMGAQIKGAGTDVIRVYGVKALRGSSYTVIPDQIETGTMMIAAAATKGNVLVKDVIPTHMEALTAKLVEAGCQVDEYTDAIRVRMQARPKPVHVTTLPYPGFPTDLQQPMAALLSVATGTSIITETIFESRFKYLAELQRMGMRVNILDRVALIEGVPQLMPGRVLVTDLRAGAALVLAGLMAEGETLVGNTHYIDRGYENMEQKFNALGADIARISEV